MSVTLANGGDQDQRKFTDIYPTPPEVTRALLRKLRISTSQTIWEPACGDGKMSKVLYEATGNVINSDITQGYDFLMWKPDQKFHWIITNPPFAWSEDFIERAYSLAPAAGFAFLLKSQYWHSKRREKLFQRIRPAQVFPLTWRPGFHFGAKGNAPTMEVLWTVWRSPYQSKFTKYEPLSK